MSAAHITSDLSLIKLGSAGRTALWLVIKDRAPTSALYAANPAVKDATTRVIKSGGDRETATNKVIVLRQQLKEALQGEATADATFDKDLLYYKTTGEDASEDAGDLESLALHARAPATVSTLLGVPADFGAKPGGAKAGKGSIYYGAKAVDGARSYQIGVAPVPASGDPVYVIANATAVRDTITGYVSAARYLVRIRALRGTQFSDWSEPATVAAR